MRTLPDLNRILRVIGMKDRERSRDNGGGGREGGSSSLNHCQASPSPRVLRATSVVSLEEMLNFSHESAAQ